MYLTKEGDTIPDIHILNQYYGRSMSLAMGYPIYLILLFGMHSDDQHILTLNYLLHRLVHIVQDEICKAVFLLNVLLNTILLLQKKFTCNLHQLDTFQQQYDMRAEQMHKHRHHLMELNRSNPDFQHTLDVISPALSGTNHYDAAIYY